MSVDAQPALETFGRFLDERYAPWMGEPIGNNAVAELRTDFADWLGDPLNTLSAWRIECWRRDRLESQANPLAVRRQLQTLDSCLSKAVDWHLIERNPLQDLRLDDKAEYSIELFSGGINQGYLRDGWAPAGVSWTWTWGNRAAIELPPVGGGTDYVLKLHIAGIYRAHPQRLFVDVNDIAVGILLCRGPAAYEFLVPAIAIDSRDRIEVVLRIPDARQPSDEEDIKDYRLLAFRVAKIEFRPMAQGQPDRQAESVSADGLPGVVAQRAVLQDMVSLGFNCEFGMVQRYVGAEPMSLFRWASVRIERLIAALDKRFAGLTARDALEVTVSPEGEFMVKDRVYGFRYHTFVNVFRGGVLERVQRNEFVRVGMLCKTLLEELREQKKLFVYHDGDASKLADIQRLVRALRGYGDNTLLWITCAPSTGQIGETSLIEQGLIRGYVSGFQAGAVGPASPHHVSWIKVACGAHRLWSAAKPSPVRDESAGPQRLT